MSVPFPGKGLIEAPTVNVDSTINIREAEIANELVVSLSCKRLANELFFETV